MGPWCERLHPFAENQIAELQGSGSAQAYSQRQFNRTRAAAIVDGAGAQPVAPWSELHTDHSARGRGIDAQLIGRVEDRLIVLGDSDGVAWRRRSSRNVPEELDQNDDFQR